MKKKYSDVIWGICLTVLGVILLGNFSNIWSIDVFFEGWWTLFIIVPSIVGIFTRGDRLSSIIFLIIGVTLLLWSRGLIESYNIFKFLFAAIIIIIGINLILSTVIKKKEPKIKINKEGFASYSGIFGGHDEKYKGESFEGANMTAVFGGVGLDLREAKIKKDTKINAVCVFGGIDIKVPSNINVKVNGLNIFGGVDNNADMKDEKAPTIYIDSTCIFGGIDIK